MSKAFMSDNNNIPTNSSVMPWLFKPNKYKRFTLTLT